MNKIKTINVTCPKCGARPTRPCMGSRIPSASSYGGGWGGPGPLSRSHTERVQHARARTAARNGGAA